MKWSLNIVKLDLRFCNTLEDCKRLREDNDIDPDLISDEKLFEYKNVVDIFFYDKETYNIVGVIPFGQSNIQFTEDFINHLTQLEPIKYKRTSLNLDEILDKISSSGLESLNKIERRFLRKFSK
jgi:hypothetical protein